MYIGVSNINSCFLMAAVTKASLRLMKNLDKAGFQILSQNLFQITNDLPLPTGNPSLSSAGPPNWIGGVFVKSFRDCKKVQILVLLPYQTFFPLF